MRRAPAFLAVLGLFAGLLLASVPSPGQTQVAAPQKYADAVQALDRWLTREVADKKLPALSLALVDDQEVVWAKGFGYADPQRKTAATAESVYCVGSVSKPFTALALMLLVEL